MKIITMLICLMLSANIVLAADKGDDHKKGEWFKKELNLNDDQLKKVQEIRKENKDELHASRKQFNELRKAFKEAMKDSKASAEDLSAKYEAFSNARDKFQRKRFEMMLKMREVLTPEQMEKFVEIKKKMKGKFHHKRKDKK